ncbi:MAG: restriction endonuclease [Chthonomonadales bacterium]
MPIPAFDEIMLPLLRAVKDGEPHQFRALMEQLADEFALTQAERQERLVGGNFVFYNRVHWAATYLAHAGLVSRPARGFVRITDRGQAVLAEGPDTLDLAYLDRFPEFREWRGRQEDGAQTTRSGGQAVVRSQEDPPSEALDQSWKRLRDDLADQLLEQVHQCAPEFFEKLVLDLLQKMGYGGKAEDTQVVGKTGDGGIDGEIKLDDLGLEMIYVQAKRWQGPVGRPKIQEFVGALHGRRGRKGVFITSGTFTPDARRYAEEIESRVVLIDGPQLVRLMMHYGVGVTTVRSLPVQRVDTDYFTSE